VREKQARLRTLEREIRQLRAELRTIREAVGRMTLTPHAGRERRNTIDPTSPLGLAVAVLRARRRPLHLDEIVREIRRRHGRDVSRGAVEAQFSRYARKGQLVRRTGPGLFAAIRSR
jgi:hypothetical protein